MESQFDIAPCKDADFPDMMHIMFQGESNGNGWSKDYIKAVYPCDTTTADCEHYAKWFSQKKAWDRSQRWIKATDKETGQILGVALWNVYTAGQVLRTETFLQKPPGPYPTPEDRQRARTLYETNSKHREAVVAESTSPVVCKCPKPVPRIRDIDQAPDLTHLAKVPAAGFQLVFHELLFWGIRFADTLDAVVMMESSSAMSTSYQAMGFRPEVRRVNWPVRYDVFGNLITQGMTTTDVFYMWRPKKSDRIKEHAAASAEKGEKDSAKEEEVEQKEQSVKTL